MGRNGNMTEACREFINSDYYRKYKDSSFIDFILRDVFGEEIKVRSLVLGGFKEIVERNAKLCEDLYSLYYCNAKVKDPALFRRILISICIDPDPRATRVRAGVVCTADAMIGMKRIFWYMGPNAEFGKEYRACRITPVFFFPREVGGINTSRAAIFGDRIDYTLFDLKNYFDLKPCWMGKTYSRQKTKQWLSSFSGFCEMVDWYGIRGILTNEDYEVYDLEFSDGRVISEYPSEFHQKWTKEYYINLRKKIDAINKTKLN